MTIPPVEVERLRQHVEAVDQWRRLKAEHELEIKASYGDPPFRPRRRAVESDLVYTRRLARMQDRICLRWDRLRRLWQDDHPAPEPDVTPTDVLDDVVSNRSIVRNLFPYTERVLQGGSAARRDQEMKDAAVWWGKKHRECLAKVRQLTQIVPSITDHPLLDESKASTPLVGIDRIEQWCRGAVAAMATPDGEVAKLRKLGDILDGWATAYIRAPRAELAKLPMLFGNDKIVTVIQREAGEPMREQLEELNELRLTLDNATDDELAEIVTVDPPRWAKASPPMTRTRENDLRQKVAGIASHLSMIVRHAHAAMEAKTPAASVQENKPPVDPKAGGDDEPPFKPTVAALDIEQALHEARTRLTQLAIKELSGRSLKTVKARLKVLERVGRIHRPEGRRKGYALKIAPAID